MTCSRGWEVVEDLRKLSKSAFVQQKFFERSKEQTRHSFYTYYLGGGVRQDFEDCVSPLEDPCLSVPLKGQR